MPHRPKNPASEDFVITIIIGEALDGKGGLFLAETAQGRRRRRRRRRERRWRRSGSAGRATSSSIFVLFGFRVESGLVALGFLCDVDGGTGEILNYAWRVRT